jgi:ABC-type multidrug transport system ATPase subunit
MRSGSGVPVVVHHGQPATIGRNDSATLRVANPLVSGTHLQISWSNGVAVATDISSTNGTYDAQGRRMTSVVVDRPVTVMLGDPRVGELIGLAPVGQVVQAPPQVPPPPMGHRSGAPLTIGRGDDVDIVVPDDLASRRHATLTLQPTPAIVDLGSLNGTQLNGQPVTRAELHDGDIVTIGNTDLVYRAGQLTVRDDTDSRNQQLVVRGVDFAVDNGTRLLLRGIDFTARTGTLTALIGPSGAGKSTLGRLLTGLTSPSGGEVFFAGHDLHADYASLRSRIGFVPQDDVVHTKLTVRQALRYSAELRLPPDTTKEKRDEICQRVMAELGLTERADLRIDKLSGGQRKRVSVAIELITSPSLLVLDEPTSGLDPALDRQVMELLQQLARGGRVVIVVTHSLAYLHLTDQVLLLAPGGLPSYFGPPAGIDQAYGTSDWANVFESVTQNPQGAWASYLLRTGRTRQEVELLMREPARPSVSRRTAPSIPPQPVAVQRRTALRQTSTLIRRQVRLIASDIGYSVFLAVLPVVLGVLALVVPGDDGFGMPPPLEAGESPSTEPGQLLVLMVLGACFMGASLTVRDLVGERPVFHRERSAGLFPGAYLASKLVVFLLASTLQAAILTTIVLANKAGPEDGALLPSGSAELLVVIALISACSAVVGMALSALVKSSEQAMPLLVVVIMTQLVMSGGLIPVTGRVGLAQLSLLFPARWGFAAGASTVDLRTIEAVAEQDLLWVHAPQQWLLSALALILIAILLALLTYSRLRLKDSRR